MSEQPGRLDALDSIRGICALAVCLFHFPVSGPLAGAAFVRNSYLFVDLFFVLSGFVIASVYEGRLGSAPTSARFLIRRFGRLWPLHVSILAVYVLAAIAQGELGADERHSVEAIFTNLALVHGLGIHSDLTWNGPSWSISVEAALYLIFALLAFTSRRPLIYGALAATGVIVLMTTAPDGMASTFDYGFFRGIAGFFTGALIARLPRRQSSTAAELAAALAVIAFVASGKLTYAAPAVFGLCVYTFAMPGGVLGQMLQTTPAKKLGEWSYSIYMVHAAVIAAMTAAATPLGLKRDGVTLIPYSEVYGLLLALGFLAVVVGISAVTYTFIENPARQAFNRLAARPASPASAA
jgi:peptidoglycan/LPS O-acetylase OafA/YrhL